MTENVDKISYRTDFLIFILLLGAIVCIIELFPLFPLGKVLVADKRIFIPLTALAMWLMLFAGFYLTRNKPMFILDDEGFTALDVAGPPLFCAGTR